MVQVTAEGVAVSCAGASKEGRTIMRRGQQIGAQHHAQGPGIGTDSQTLLSCQQSAAMIAGS